MRTPVSILICLAFLINLIGPLPVQANDLLLPKPGVMVSLSPEFAPAVLKGIKVHPDNPFKFDFILDKGDSNLNDSAVKEESKRLIKYFLASLTVPEGDLWVNLSPYEKDRIVPEAFGKTEMGRDLLAQDYLLKQITASLIYPEDEIGKKFWNKIYQEAQKKFHTTNIPINTFNKVWIVPEKAVVYENAPAGTAYVAETKLKVMLEEDYLALSKNAKAGDASFGFAERRSSLGMGAGLELDGSLKELRAPKDERAAGPATNGSTRHEGASLASQIVREIVIPELTREINEGKNFAQLRQVYNSLILAAWYKKKIKTSILSKVYQNQNKIAGITIDNPQDKQLIYEQYLKAFKKGVYNYIKEEQDPSTQQMIPRKYFSGGVLFNPNTAMVVSDARSNPAMFSKISRGVLFTLGVLLGTPDGKSAEELVDSKPTVTVINSKKEEINSLISQLYDIDRKKGYQASTALIKMNNPAVLDALVEHIKNAGSKAHAKKRIERRKAFIEGVSIQIGNDQRLNVLWGEFLEIFNTDLLGGKGYQEAQEFLEKQKNPDTKKYAQQLLEIIRKNGFDYHDLGKFGRNDLNTFYKLAGNDGKILKTLLNDPQLSTDYKEMIQDYLNKGEDALVAGAGFLSVIAVFITLGYLLNTGLDSSGRSFRIMAMKLYGPLAPLSMIQALEAVAREGNRHAVELLDGMDFPEAGNALRNLALDNKLDEYIRIPACQFLYKYEPQTALDILYGLAQGEKERSYYPLSPTRALANINTTESALVLEKLILADAKDRGYFGNDSNLGRSAGYALGHMSILKAVEILKGLFNKDPYVQNGEINTYGDNPFIIERLGEINFPGAAVALGEMALLGNMQYYSYYDHLKKVVAALGESPTPQAVIELKKLAGSETIAVRPLCSSGVFKILAKLAPSIAVPILVDRLLSEEKLESSYKDDLLSILEELNVPQELENIAKKTTNGYLRHEAASLWGKTSPVEAEQFLAKFAQDPDYGNRMNAINEWSRLNPQGAVVVLDSMIAKMSGEELGWTVSILSRIYTPQSAQLLARVASQTGLKEETAKNLIDALIKMNALNVLHSLADKKEVHILIRYRACQSFLEDRGDSAPLEALAEENMKVLGLIGTKIIKILNDMNRVEALIRIAEGQVPEEIRLEAAQCLLEKGHPKGLEILRSIAKNVGGRDGFRFEATKQLVKKGHLEEVAENLEDIIRNGKDNNVQLAAAPMWAEQNNGEGYKNLIRKLEEMKLKNDFNETLLVMIDQNWEGWIADLDKWTENIENLRDLLAMVKLAQKGKIIAYGFEYDGFMRLARDIIASGVSRYTYTMEQLLAFNFIDQDKYRGFRGFMVNSNVSLNSRMGLAEHYMEMLSVKDLMGQETRQIDIFAFRDLELSIYALEEEFDNVIPKIIDNTVNSYRNIKTIEPLMTNMRKNLLRYLLERELSAQEETLLNNPESRKAIFKILSIVGTLGLVDFKEKKLMRRAIIRALNVLFLSYDEKKENPLVIAKKALNKFLFDDMDAQGLATLQDVLRETGTSLGRSNKEVKGDLVANHGYSKDFWDKGIDLETTVTEGLTAEQKMEQIQHATFELVETIIFLGLKEFKGAPLGIERADEFSSTAKAKELMEAYKEAVKKGQINVDKHVDNRLKEILVYVKAKEAEPVVEGPMNPQTFRVTIKKDLLEEMLAGTAPGAACFNVNGIHREMPLMHALEANAGFIQVYSNGRMVGTAVVIFAPEGVYVEPKYDDSKYNLDIVYGKALLKLLQLDYVPRLILNNTSAGAGYLSKYKDEKGYEFQDGVITKVPTIFRDQYFDSGAVNHEGNVKFSVKSSFIVTRESVERNGGFSVELPPQTDVNKAGDGDVKPQGISHQLARFIADRRPKYLFLVPAVMNMLNIVGPETMLNGGVERVIIDIDDALDEHIATAADARKRKLTEKEKDEAANLIVEFLEKQDWPVKTLTPVGGDNAMSASNATGGIDLNPTDKTLQVRNPNGDIKFTVDPAMLQRFQNAPGFIPVKIDVAPLEDLRLFMGLELFEASKT